MIVSLKDIVKVKAKELGISNKVAQLAIRSVDGLINEIIESSGFDIEQDYTEEEFKKKFFNLYFIIPEIGLLKADYKLYKGKRKYYVESRKIDTCV